MNRHPALSDIERARLRRLDRAPAATHQGPGYAAILWSRRTRGLCVSTIPGFHKWELRVAVRPLEGRG